MAENEQKLIEISKSHLWRGLKAVMEEEINRVCDLDKLESESDLRGAQMTRKVFKNIVRKVDGARDAEEFTETGR